MAIWKSCVIRLLLKGMDLIYLRVKPEFLGKLQEYLCVGRHNHALNCFLLII